MERRFPAGARRLEDGVIEGKPYGTAKQLTSRPDCDAICPGLKEAGFEVRRVHDLRHRTGSGVRGEIVHPCRGEVAGAREKALEELANRLEHGGRYDPGATTT